VSRVARRWDRDKIIRALQTDAKRRGRAPTRVEWQKATPGRCRPTAQTVCAIFGSWSAGLGAAGLTPRAPGGQPRERCERHGEDMRVRPDGKHECTACRRETQRERRRRARKPLPERRCLWCSRWFQPARRTRVYCDRSCTERAKYHMSQGGESPRAAAAASARERAA
jgi:hypothetical protein